MWGEGQILSVFSPTQKLDLKHRHARKAEGGLLGGRGPEEGGGEGARVGNGGANVSKFICTKISYGNPLFCILAKI